MRPAQELSPLKYRDVALDMFSLSMNISFNISFESFVLFEYIVCVCAGVFVCVFVLCVYVCVYVCMYDFVCMFVFVCLSLSERCLVCLPSLNVLLQL